MKPLFALLLMVMVCRAEDFTLANGTKYKAVKVLRAATDGLVVETDSGIATLKFQELPVAVQKQYGWVDPAIIAAAHAKQAAEQDRIQRERTAAADAEEKKHPAASRKENTADGDVVIARSSNGWTARRLPSGVSHAQSIGGGN